MEEQNARQGSESSARADLFQLSLLESMDISKANDLKQELQEALLHKEGVYLDMSSLMRIDAAIVQLLMIFASAAKIEKIQLEWDQSSDVFNRATKLLDVSDHFFQVAA